MIFRRHPQTAGIKRRALSMTLIPFIAPFGVGCESISSGDRNDLSALRQVTVTITGKTSFAAGVADTDATRELGLMNITNAELNDDGGMLFVFDMDRPLSFWMRNTIIPLDIAYIRSDGLIVKTYTMTPLNEMGYPSIEAAKYALEVKAGQFSKHGIGQGDHVEIPADVVARD